MIWIWWLEDNDVKDNVDDGIDDDDTDNKNNDNVRVKIITINIISTTIVFNGRYKCYYQSNLYSLSLLELVVPVLLLAQELSTLDACLIYYDQHIDKNYILR